MRSLRRPHPISPQPPLSLPWWGPGCAGAGLMDGGSSPPPPPVPLPAAPAQGHKGIMSPQPLNTLPHPCPTARGGWLCVMPPTGPGQACGTARVSLPTHRCVPLQTQPHRVGARLTTIPAGSATPCQSLTAPGRGEHRGLTLGAGAACVYTW